MRLDRHNNWHTSKLTTLSLAKPCSLERCESPPGHEISICDTRLGWSRTDDSLHTAGDQGHSYGREPPAYNDPPIWNQCSIDIAPGVAHAKAYSFTSCIVFDGSHFVHGDQNAIIGAGEARERRMTTTPDGIGRAGDAEDANSKLNFGNRGWLKDTIWSQPCGGRPNRNILVGTVYIEMIEPRSCMHGWTHQCCSASVTYSAPSCWVTRSLLR